MPASDRLGRKRLWFTDGARYGKVEVRLSDGGGLEITRHEMGGGERAAWGEDDEEVTLELDVADVAKLALALLTERYKGKQDAVEQIRDLCDAHDVPAKYSVWT